jgi:hypothetical protein
MEIPMNRREALHPKYSHDCENVPPYDGGMRGMWKSFPEHRRKIERRYQMNASATNAMIDREHLEVVATNGS